jgi:hypothetical protein
LSDRQNSSIYAVEEEALPYKAAYNTTPVIFWGSHHKAGTYLAQKIFSLICAHRGWCCVFGNTRDSRAAMQAALQSEPVRVMGHNQWVWLPEEFNLPYRFVHFYRHPYKKVLSGYRYHRMASESWCKHPQNFTQVCQSPLAAANLSRDNVLRFCRSVHLCQTCCQREHERPERRQYQARDPAEYAYLCRHLGNVRVSLADTLQTLSRDEGVRTEAALAYFESLRMARIVNHTWHDPYTLNIDIDNTKHDFEGVAWAILRHVGLDFSPDEVSSIARELSFFDFGRSPIYRWSLSNPLFSHIDARAEDLAAATEKRELLTALRDDPATKLLYAPVLALMQGAIGSTT